MNSPYQFLESLLPYIEAYEKEVGRSDMDISSFTLWLNKQVVLGHGRKEVPMEHQQSIETYISAMIIRMSKYAKHYGKMVLKDSALKSLDDFVILVGLMEKESRKKAEILSSSLLEFPTGIGIINRLLKQGMLQEFDDPNDRRSKRIGLTEKGRQELYGLFHDMRQMSDIINGDLENDEKLELLTMLTHLDRFHQRLYHNKQLTSLQSITNELEKELVE